MATRRGISSAVVVQRVISRSLTSIVARSASKPLLGTRQVVLPDVARGISSANSVFGALGLANAGPSGGSSSLRLERVDWNTELANSKRKYQTSASAQARDGRVC